MPRAHRTHTLQGSHSAHQVSWTSLELADRQTTRQTSSCICRSHRPHETHRDIPDRRSKLHDERTLKQPSPGLSHGPSPKRSSTQAGRDINRRWVLRVLLATHSVPLLLAHGSSPPPDCCVALMRAGASKFSAKAPLPWVRRSQLRIRVRRRRMLVPRCGGSWGFGVCGLNQRPPCASRRGPSYYCSKGRAFHPGEADLRPLPQTCMQAIIACS